MEDLQLQSAPLVAGPLSDLASPYSERHYGVEDRVKAGAGSLSFEDELEIRIARRPLLWRLEDLYAQGHNGSDFDSKLLLEYDAWIIAHAVGAIRRHGNISVTALGYRAEFVEEGISTVGLVPSPEYEDRLGLNVEFAANVGLEGDLDPPEEIVELLAGHFGIGARATLNFSTKVGVVGRLDLKSKKKIVSALGICHPACEWLFTKTVGDDLLDDHVMLQTVLVPKGQAEINATVFAYARLRRPFPLQWSRVGAPIWTEPVSMKFRVGEV